MIRGLRGFSKDKKTTKLANSKATSRVWRLTENDQEADEDGSQGAHTEPDNLSLLEELAILAKVSHGTVAHVEWLAVDTNTTVETRIGQTFVFVDTSFSVQCHNLGLAATLFFIVLMRI